MAGAETLYTLVTRGTTFFERGRQTVSSLPVYRDGALVAPTEADCAYLLVDSAGTTIADPAVEVVDDIAQVTIEAADLPSTLTLGVGYAERWTLALPDDSVRTVQRQVVLGKFELHPPMDQSELTDEYPDLLVDFAGFGSHFQRQLDSAWREVCREITRQGDFPDIYCEPSDLYDWYKQLALERIFRALSKTQSSNQRWFDLWQHHLVQVDRAKSAVRFLPDRDRDGLADSQARESAAKSYHVNVPPTRRPRWDPRW